MANLLSNAAKFSPRDSTVEISAERLEGIVRVGVRDRGSGIPSEFHAKVFTKFSQSDSSDSRAKGGSGLGLAITKAIVEGMGGTIRFESSAGAGTTFMIDLPAAAPEQADDQRVRPPSDSAKKSAM
jgi:signal transduction histidine kinase